LGSSAVVVPVNDEDFFAVEGPAGHIQGHCPHV
jgi:hypothetical protein